MAKECLVLRDVIDDNCFVALPYLVTNRRFDP
jgi:hypothetical protein